MVQRKVRCGLLASESKAGWQRGLICKLSIGANSGLAVVTHPAIYLKISLPSTWTPFPRRNLLFLQTQSISHIQVWPLLERRQPLLSASPYRPHRYFHCVIGSRESRLITTASNILISSDPGHLVAPSQQFHHPSS